ncbi:nucleotide exchange factor GrpE [Fulvivirgaceae bacterium BMA10]|uniref:Protein GrpE n=1 Tax=Splendidivirga corallicola TaxID=3051826 RepID=A0ABT8KIJ7_9BACT|nr:nucleotide exchange factor GrpE [Fulvivirgaceae bacterium BMA10]
MKKENLEDKEQMNGTEDTIEGQEQEQKASSQIEKEEENKEEEIEEELSEAEKLQVELTESKDKYLRIYSEFENYRRRTAKERLELISTASEELIVNLLPILDDFERAQNQENKKADAKAMEEGYQLIYNKFKNILEQKGLKTMDHKQGVEFDAELHEAITQIPAPSKKLKGKVVDVIEKGYYLGEKVIRFAKVVIGS